MSKIVKSQIESNSQPLTRVCTRLSRCVKDRQITNWKQFTTCSFGLDRRFKVCQRSSNHKLKAIHNPVGHWLNPCSGVSKIVKSQIESNSQPVRAGLRGSIGCVKDRQITNWKQFTTGEVFKINVPMVCQRSSNHKLKAIHNFYTAIESFLSGVSKIVKSQIESNSQPHFCCCWTQFRCVKDRQITNWKQFTTDDGWNALRRKVCQRSSNHKLKAIHNIQTLI